VPSLRASGKPDLAGKPNRIRFETEEKMQGIFIEPLEAPPMDEREVEVVERKGRGHPDTICDGIAEAASVAFSRYYLKEFGRILHHNVDKALLIGGRTTVQFGGGEMLQPISVHLAGRVTMQVGEQRVPVERLYVEAARAWTQTYLPNLNAREQIYFYHTLRPGSPDLVDLFLRGSGVPLANDTSAGIGYAPLSETERVVLGTELFLNSAPFKTQHPEVGEDIKVMALRRGSEITLTMAIAFVSRYVRDLQEYQNKKQAVTAAVVAKAAELTRYRVSAHINAADDETRGSVYLTLTGTSAEAGDDGEVGRGNRVNGLIAPFRPASHEAIAGKNPINHVGKLYNIAAQKIAETIVGQVAEVTEAHCCLLSRIGQPITEPAVISLKLRAASLSPSIREQAQAVAMEQMTRLCDLWQPILEGRICLF